MLKCCTTPCEVVVEGTDSGKGESNLAAVPIIMTHEELEILQDVDVSKMDEYDPSLDDPAEERVSMDGNHAVDVVDFHSADTFCDESVSRKSCRIYAVEIEANQTEIGLVMGKLDENKLIVRAINEGGAIHTWNTQHPEMVVAENDVLLAMNNDCRNADQIVNKLKSAGKMQLNFMCPARRRVILFRDEDCIGVKLVNKNTDQDLVIHAIEEGAVLKWNQTHPDESIAPGDRIIEVNGFSGSASSMVNNLNRHENRVEFEVEHYS